MNSLARTSGGSVVPAQLPEAKQLASVTKTLGASQHWLFRLRPRSPRAPRRAPPASWIAEPIAMVPVTGAGRSSGRSDRPPGRRPRCFPRASAPTGELHLQAGGLDPSRMLRICSASMAVSCTPELLPRPRGCFFEVEVEHQADGLDRARPPARRRPRRLLGDARDAVDELDAGGAARRVVRRQPPHDGVGGSTRRPVCRAAGTGCGMRRRVDGISARWWAVRSGREMLFLDLRPLGVSCPTFVGPVSAYVMVSSDPGSRSRLNGS